MNDQPFRHPSTLWEGFWGVQLLHIGQSLGLFESLRHPTTAQELASRKRLEPGFTALWCQAAAANGLIQEEEERYQLPPESAEWLTASQGFTQSHIHLVGRMHETFQAVFAGRALPEPPISLRLMLSEHLLQNYRWALEQVPAQVPFLARSLQQGERALEVGCGIGLGLTTLRGISAQLELYGLESDFECAREAERTTRGVIHLGDLPGDRFGKTFDLVLCFRALASAKDPELLLADCARLLTPNGCFLLGSEAQDRRQRRKSEARSSSERLIYQLLAGEKTVHSFSRTELLEMLDRAKFAVVAEVEAPDWGTPLYVCTHKGNSSQD